MEGQFIWCWEEALWPSGLLLLPFRRGLSSAKPLTKYLVDQPCLVPKQWDPPALAKVGHGISCLCQEPCALGISRLENLFFFTGISTKKNKKKHNHVHFRVGRARPRLPMQHFLLSPWCSDQWGLAFFNPQASPIAGHGRDEGYVKTRMNGLLSCLFGKQWSSLKCFRSITSLWLGGQLSQLCLGTYSMAALNNAIVPILLNCPLFNKFGFPLLTFKAQPKKWSLPWSCFPPYWPSHMIWVVVPWRRWARAQAWRLWLDTAW